MTLKLADDSQSPDVRRIAVVTAGLSEPSSTRLLADLLGEATKAALLEGARDAEIEVVELRPLAHAITDALLTGFPTGDLAAAVESVASADAVIAVTPVFSASFSGLFKMFFDVLEPGTLDGMPVLAAATAGSARHSLVLDHALRPLFSYLHAVVVPTAVFAASEDWGANGVAGDLRKRVDRAAGELADLVVRRPALHRVDPFGDVPDFASMLGS
ncbi:MAG: NADPH-dependent reductase [Marmoricola sp.]|nr:NADPH-dependent reductase [Marmoricola sp.]